MSYEYLCRVWLQRGLYVIWKRSTIGIYFFHSILKFPHSVLKTLFRKRLHNIVVHSCLDGFNNYGLSQLGRQHHDQKILQRRIIANRLRHQPIPNQQVPVGHEKTVPTTP